MVTKSFVAQKLVDRTGKQSPFLGCEELAELLGLSERHLRSLVRQSRIIQPMRFGTV